MGLFSEKLVYIIGGNFCVSKWVELTGILLCSGARFSKVPKSFRARKATTEISNLKFTELFFSHIFNMNKFSLHAKFHAYKLLCF